MESPANTPIADPNTDEAVRARRAARLRTAADFSTTPAPRADSSIGHRHMVGLLKIALPLLALGLIVTMAIYSVLFKPDGAIAISYSDIDREQGEVVMTSPRFVGADKDNQPFQVIASKARQDPNDTALVELDNIDASLVLNEGAHLRLIAGRGVLDTSNQLLQLTGPIELTSSEGYRIHTDEARADLKNGLLTGQKPIDADGSFGSIHADGFQASRDDRTMNFVGHVTIHFIPSMVPADE
jgi:lipopolysaccharide export system protein LptC